MRKIIIFIIILLTSVIFLYKGFEFKNIEYIKQNYYKKSLNVNLLTIDKLSIIQIVKLKPINSKVIKGVVLFEEFGRPNIKNSNTIIGAHSGSGRNAIFSSLDKLDIRDEILFYYDEKEYKYSVIKKFLVNEKEMKILNNIKDKTTLTLMTCNEKNDKYRLIVILDLIDFA